MAEQSVEAQFVAVTVAARESGLSERTTYRLAETGRVPSRKSEGGLLVDLAAVKAIAAAKATRRHAAMPPASADVNRQAAAGGGNVANDGELAARVIARLEGGASQIEIVQELRLPPQTVRQIHREWRQLREESAQAEKGPSVLERLAKLEQQLLDLDERGWSFDQSVRNVDEKISQLATFERHTVQCKCGAHGAFRYVIVCSGCGQQSLFGWPAPPRRR